MISQPVFSILPCSSLPSGTCRTPGLIITMITFPPPPMYLLELTLNLPKSSSARKPATHHIHHHHYYYYYYHFHHHQGHHHHHHYHHFRFLKKEEKKKKKRKCNSKENVANRNNDHVFLTTVSVTVITVYFVMGNLSRYSTS